MLATFHKDIIAKQATAKGIKWDKKFKVSSTFGIAMCAMAKQVSKVHSTFGMALPILYELETRLPALFNLLVPRDDWENEVEEYGCTSWCKSAVSGRKIYGWSNFPIMWWIVVYLIQENVIEIADNCHVFQTKSNLPSLDDATARFRFVGFATCNGEFTLAELVKFLLFDVLDRRYDAIQTRINETLLRLTKDDFYRDVKNFFILDGDKVKLGEMKQPPASAFQPIGSANHLQRMEAGSLSNPPNVGLQESMKGKRLYACAAEHIVGASCGDFGLCHNWLQTEKLLTYLSKNQLRVRNPVLLY
jgi:hypothetical protein